MKVTAIVELSAPEIRALRDGMAAAVTCDVRQGEGEVVLKHGDSFLSLTRNKNEYSISYDRMTVAGARKWLWVEFTGHRHALNSNCILPFLAGPFREIFRKAEISGKLNVDTTHPEWRWDTTTDDHRPSPRTLLPPTDVQALAEE